ncbi:MAG: hypothetical protein GX589_01975 [Deltaproteobacteria bacterium]|nr:hypothetical protein [Deltaproteobacteria bacterium]
MTSAPDSAPITIQARYLPNQGTTADFLKISKQILKEAASKTAKLTKDARKQAALRIWKARRRTRKNAWLAGSRAWQAEEAYRLLELQTRFKQSLDDAKAEYLKLCLMIATEVIGAELTTNKASLIKRIENALTLVSCKYETRIAVHPSDLELVTKSLEEDLPEQFFKVMEDPELPPGDARIETSAGTIALNWQAHLQRLLTTLRSNVLEKR